MVLCRLSAIYPWRIENRFISNSHHNYQLIGTFLHWTAKLYFAIFSNRGIWTLFGYLATPAIYIQRYIFVYIARRSDGLEHWFQIFYNFQYLHKCWFVIPNHKFFTAAIAQQQYRQASQSVRRTSPSTVTVTVCVCVCHWLRLCVIFEISKYHLCIFAYLLRINIYIQCMYSGSSLVPEQRDRLYHKYWIGDHIVFQQCKQKRH